MDWSYTHTWKTEPKETVKQMILTLVNYEDNETIKKVLTYTQTSKNCELNIQIIRINDY